MKYRAKALIIIIVCLVIAGLFEYIVIFQVHDNKQRIPYSWVHNGYEKVEFENLPQFQMKRFDSVHDMFYIDQENFERMHNSFVKMSSRNDKTKENLAAQLLDTGKEANIAIKPPNVVVSPNVPNENNKPLHVPEPPSLSGSAKKSKPKNPDSHNLPVAAGAKEIVKRESNVFHQPPQAGVVHQYEDDDYSSYQEQKVQDEVANQQHHRDEGDLDFGILEKGYPSEVELDQKQPYIDMNQFELQTGPGGPKIVKKPLEPEILVEYDSNRPYRNLTLFEKRGNNIMMTLRTTHKYHDKRLPLLYNTWMKKVNASNIFLVTDGQDKKWLKLASTVGMHYILTTCGKTYSQYQLCCKAGIELNLMFNENNRHYDWLCHIDDDIYINLDPLTHILSKFNPKTEPVYFGRSGSDWHRPREVMQGAKYGRRGQKYHFAVGGMYCLSRAMLELAKPYLVGGKTFAQSCIKTLEPEDVTVGMVVGVVLKKTLSRTEMIYTHGLHLISTVDPSTLQKQIAFSYGFGSTPWGLDNFNCIYVPDGLFTIAEDKSQFKSLHCHLYPQESWCVKRRRDLELHLVTRKDYKL